MSKRKFIGRKNELRVMEHLFTAEKDEWHILHIYGPAGVGKTVLLHQFQSINQEYFPVIYVNCHKNFLTVEDFLGSIHNTILNQRILIKQSSSMDIIENLTAIAKEHSTVVLILDGI